MVLNRMADILCVYVTCPTEEIAANIGKAMIERRYAACANILPPGRSFFRWEGKIEEATEATIIFKTTKANWPTLRDAVNEVHPYDLPCILALPVEDGYEPFLRWVKDEMGPFA